ncbi:MAG: 4Fe-4S single cluster domain-containing protein [Methanoregula sp.]|jgi:anaerobic ribonucleoside-triphosphate reductase activating protein
MMEPKENEPGTDKGAMINLAGFLARSAVNGPGTRTVIWVQGCPIRCEGCFNPRFWSFAPAHSISVPALVQRILSVPGIDGVTFSGGEPFAQAAALAVVGEELHDAGLSLVTYTGYTCDELLRRGTHSWLHLLRVTDLLIAGPFVQSLSCAAPLIGSSNQSVIRLSDRIPPVSSCVSDRSSAVEFTIAPDGSLTATGFPTGRLVQAFAPCGEEVHDHVTL